MYVLHPRRRQEQRRRRRSRCWPWISSLIPIVFEARARARSHRDAALRRDIWSLSRLLRFHVELKKNERKRDRGEKEKRWRKSDEKNGLEVSLTPLRENASMMWKQRRGVRLHLRVRLSSAAECQWRDDSQNREMNQLTLCPAGPAPFAHVCLLKDAKNLL